MGDEKMSFSDPDRIGHRRKMFDERSLVLNYFYGNIRQGFKNGFWDRILFSLFIEINSFNLNGQQFQIPNSKSQAPNKPQVSISNDRPSPHPSPLGGEGKGEGVWNFEFGSLDLFGIWPACAKPRPAGRTQVLGIWCLLYTLDDLLKLFLIWEAR